MHSHMKAAWLTVWVSIHLSPMLPPPFNFTLHVNITSKGIVRGWQSEIPYPNYRQPPITSGVIKTEAAASGRPSRSPGSETVNNPPFKAGCSKHGSALLLFPSFRVRVNHPSWTVSERCSSGWVMHSYLLCFLREKEGWSENENSFIRGRLKSRKGTR